MPKKLLMLSKLREEAKQPSKPKPKVPKSKLLDSSKLMGYEMKLPGMKKELKPIPVFQQQEGEKNRQFFRRMNQQVAVSQKLIFKTIFNLFFKEIQIYGSVPWIILMCVCSLNTQLIKDRRGST